MYRDCEGFGRIGGHVAGLMESLGVRKEGGGGSRGDVESEERGMEVVDMHEDGGQGEEGITVEFA